MAKCKSITEMAEEIRDEALDNIKYNGITLRELCDKLKSNEYVPVVRGEWIEHPTKDSVLCSCCHADWNLLDNDTYRFCYCPNCGARMDGEKHE